MQLLTKQPKTTLLATSFATLLLAACSQHAEPEKKASAAPEATPPAKTAKLKPATQPVLIASNNPSVQLKPQAAQLNSVTREQIKANSDALDKLVANTECDSQSQCKVLAVGSRACGGPSQYLVYSTKHATAADVEKLADTITQQAKQFNAQNEIVSTCQHLTKPAAQCKNNQCVAVNSSVRVF